MSHFRHHVFFCCNQRGEGETCCNNAGATVAQTYAKDRIGALRLKGAGKVRINKAGCMDRCDEGPVLVVYPEAVWYTYVAVSYTHLDVYKRQWQDCSHGQSGSDRAPMGRGQWARATGSART